MNHESMESRNDFKFSSSDYKIQEILVLVHLNVCGPMDVTSIRGSRYSITFIYDFSRNSWFSFIKLKNNAL